MIIIFPRGKSIDEIDFNIEIDWTGLDNVIQEILIDHNINLSLPFMNFINLDGEDILLDYDQYEELNGIMLERYDGDGINDMEGSPKIKYWFLGGSEMNTGIGKGQSIETRKWKLTEEETANYVKLGYDLIKDNDSDFKVLLGGSAGMCTWQVGEGCVRDEGIADTVDDNFYYNLVSELTGDNYCEDLIFDYHASSAADDFKGQIEHMNIVDEILDEFDYSGNEIWTTDIGGSWDEYGGYTEIDQSGDVLRRYTYTIANGQEKLFWTRVEEYNWRGENLFDYYGLINNPINDEGKTIEKDRKKLSYYTYKLMVEILEGSDWDNIQTIQEGNNNIYVYKFDKNGENIYVIWWDYYSESDYGDDDTKTISSSTLGISGTHTIIDAIPHFEDGSLLEESNEVYPYIFDMDTIDDSNSSIILGKSPVFVVEGSKGYDDFLN